MIQAAIEKILDLGDIRTVELHGRPYAREADRLGRMRKPEEHQPDAVQVSTLDALVDYLVGNPDGLDIPSLFLHVVNRARVELLGPLQPANGNARFCYMAATFTPPNFDLGRWYPVDEFVVGLQSAFMPTIESGAVISMLANMANEAIRQNTDDGFSQTIAIKTGLTTKSEVKVKNPIELQPVCTFREAAQPLGGFILRLKDQGNGAPLVALYCADEKLMQLEAIQAVGVYLKARLEEKGAVVQVFS